MNPFYRLYCLVSFLTWKLFLIGFILCTSAHAQNIYRNWYFGQNAGLSFATNPPTILAGSAMDTNEGSAVISDNNGNLLFYTDGMTVWNQLHQIMANGTGLLGSTNSIQAALIVKRPNSNGIYYIFTVDALGASNGLMYHEVDMNLAAGLGSVTTQNTQLFTPSTEQLAGTRHCNGTDVWVMVHEGNNTNNFRAYLVTAAGINTTAVLSQIGSTITPVAGGMGSIKFSESGRQMLFCANNSSINPNGQGFYELLDFDPATGIVSNPRTLALGYATSSGEFSLDGSKLYGSIYDQQLSLCQWDMCGNSDSAIIASRYNIPAQYNAIVQFQMAINNKIYIATGNFQQTMGVINNPSSPGSACGYSAYAQSVVPNLNRAGVPNFVSGYSRKAVPFTYLIDTLQSCQTVHFTGTNACQMKLNPVQSLSWNFGDPASGAANVSNLNSASHIYSSVGNYTVQLVLNYTCYSDTVNQVINIPALSPQLLINNSISNQITVCSGNTVNLLASGANSYSWSTGQTSSSISISPVANVNYTVYGRDSVSGCASQKVLVVNLSPCLGVEENKTENKFISIFPNPAKGLLSVRFENEAIRGSGYVLELFTTLGIKLMRQEIESTAQTDLDVHDLEAGIYTVLIKNSHGQVYSTKLLLSK